MTKRQMTQYERMWSISQRFEGAEKKSEEHRARMVSEMIIFFREHPVKGLWVSTTKLIASHLIRPRTSYFWAKVFVQVFDIPEELGSFRRKVCMQTPEHRVLLRNLLTRQGEARDVVTSKKLNSKKGVEMTSQEDILAKL